MNIIHNVSNEQRLINYFKDSVRILAQNAKHNKQTIIFDMMEICELYFTNQIKVGDIKKKIIIIVCSEIFNMNENDISDIVEHNINNKLIKKCGNKILAFIKRYELKKKIKKNYLKNL